MLKNRTQNVNTICNTKGPFHQSPLVVVTQGTNPYQNTLTALKSLHLPNLKGKRILLKPNAGRLVPPKRGITTHPSVIAAAIDFFQQLKPAELFIGESPILGVKALDALKIAGITDIARERGVTLVDLDEKPPFILPIPEGKLLKKLRICAFIREVDFIVSLPVMKTHMHTGVSLSIKNMKGVLWKREKARLHQLEFQNQDEKLGKPLDVAVVDMIQVLRPHLAVIDGTVGMEGLGPSEGEPKEAQLIVASCDCLAADSVATYLMGFDPVSIPHLVLSYKRGIGEIDLQKMKILPEDFKKFRQSFLPPPQKISIQYPNVEVFDCNSCSACLSTTLLFLRRFLNQVPPCVFQEDKLIIGIGKELKSPPQGTILIGNCTAGHKKRGLYVPGCPPIASSILDRLKEEEKKNQKK